MKLYKIMVIGLLLNDNAVHPFGTEVREDQLTRPVAELLAEKYIEEVPQTDVEEEPVIEVPVEDLIPPVVVDDIPLAEVKPDSPDSPVTPEQDPTILNEGPDPEALLKGKVKK